MLCRVNDKYQVVEYSEISSKTAEMKNDQGELMYSAGNICNHYFTRAFLELCGYVARGTLSQRRERQQRLPAMVEALSCCPWPHPFFFCFF